MTIVELIDRKLYPQFARNWDDILFRGRILQRIGPDSVVLDVGAGAGIVREMNFKGQVKRMCGIDLDERVKDNPMLDEGLVADATNIPYLDETFDVVFADNVVEHLEHPERVFSEVRRVLKTGGVFLFKTPNATHYMPVIARCTPHWFHQMVNARRGRAAVDTFPTRYRANTRAAVAKLATSASFAVSYVERIEGRPEYLRFSWPTYLIGAIYERIVNSSRFLAPFRILLLAELVKR